MYNRGGNITVSGNAAYGANNESVNIWLENGSASSTGSLLTIGNGTTSSSLSLLGGSSCNLVNYSNNEITVSTNSALLLSTYDDGNPHPFNTSTAALRNAGTMNLYGTLRHKGNHFGNIPIQNSGNLHLSGTSSGFELQAAPSVAYLSANIINQTGGIISGQGTFTFTNSTGNPSYNTMSISQFGDLSPTGTLALVNTNVTCSGGNLNIQISGSNSNSGIQLSGNGAAFSLNGGANSLRVQLNNNFSLSPGANTWRIVNAQSVTGTFANIITPNIGVWSVSYSGNAIDLSVLVPSGTIFKVQ